MITDEAAAAIRLADDAIIRLRLVVLMLAVRAQREVHMGGRVFWDFRRNDWMGSFLGAVVHYHRWSWHP